MYVLVIIISRISDYLKRYIILFVSFNVYRWKREKLKFSQRFIILLFDLNYHSD